MVVDVVVDDGVVDDGVVDVVVGWASDAGARA